MDGESPGQARIGHQCLKKYVDRPMEIKSCRAVGTPSCDMDINCPVYREFVLYRRGLITSIGNGEDI